MFRVLVFPSSNEPALEIINALRKSNKFLVMGASSVDPKIDPSAALLKYHFTVPWFGHPTFRESFEKLIEESGADLVFPTVDAIVAEFSTWKHPRARFVTPASQTAYILLSKRSTYQVLSKTVPVPRVYSSAEQVICPAYAKPDRGAGSRGHRILIHPEDVQLAFNEGLLVTEYLPGNEYTVDCLSDMTGNLLVANVRVRHRTAGGIALCTESVSQHHIVQHIQRITKSLPLRGPWFAQFREDNEGKAKLMEINARVGGSMTLTRLEGLNIPAMAAFMFLGFEIEIPQKIGSFCINRVLANVVTCPAFKMIIWDLDDTIIRKDGKLDPEAAARLVDLYNRGINQVLLTRNSDACRVLETLPVPRVFAKVVVTEDKVNALANILTEFRISPAECIMVNDSNSERRALQKAFQGLRIVTPD